jgi:hypothetical protein
MLLRKFFAAWWADWTGRMSGVASIALTFWATFFPPTFSGARWALVAVAIICFALGSYHIWAKERRALEDEREKSKKHKVVFAVDEMASRFFLQAPAKDRVLIIARIRLRFENRDIHDWNMKRVAVTLSHVQKQEIPTYIAAERYYGMNGVEIPRESFEGMMIQAGRLTEWYTCEVWLQVAEGEMKNLDEFTGLHNLRVSMQASNQPPFDCTIFPIWDQAITENGGMILFCTAPDIPYHENRRLRD